MFKNIVRAFSDYRLEVETRNELASLNDAALQDIGIYRCDIKRLAREHVRMMREEAQ